MNKGLFFIVFSFTYFSSIVPSLRMNPIPSSDSKFPTVTSWVQACKKMPRNRDAKEIVDCSKHSPFFEIADDFFNHVKYLFISKDGHQQAHEEFKYILNLWLKMMAAGTLEQKRLWSLSNTGKTLPTKSFYNINDQLDIFQPYVQKLIAQSGDQFYIHGDLHGDMHSLILELEFLVNSGVIDDKFRIIADNVWFLFLGDYVDRGKYGTEVIYTLLRLSLANPDRVILVRGNHEEDCICAHYGFKAEVLQKFTNPDIYSSIIRMYDLLPVALYLGLEDKKQSIINYIQCCHGGIEAGYDPKVFLDNTKTSYQLVGNLYCSELLKEADTLLQKQNSEFMLNTMFFAHKDKHAGFYQNYSPLNTKSLGFLWTDFNVKDSALVLYNNDRGFEYGSLAAKNILQAQSSEKSKIRGIIRAHQHVSDMMKPLVRNKGVYKMWRADEISLFRTFKDGLVWTFNVSPDSLYGQKYQYNFHTFAKIVLENNYNDWQMQVFNINV